MKDKIRHGTTTLGIACKDGVILAADSRATMGHYVATKKAQKIVPIAPTIAVATAGSASEAQQTSKYLQAEIRVLELKLKRKVLVKEVANLVAGMFYYNMKYPTGYGLFASFILAGTDETGSYVYDCGADGTISLIDDYVCDGSGTEFAVGVLEALYDTSMNIADGSKLAVKAINSSLSRDVFSGNSITVYAFNKDGMKEVFHEKAMVKVKE